MIKKKNLNTTQCQPYSKFYRERSSSEGFWVNFCLASLTKNSLGVSQSESGLKSGVESGKLLAEELFMTLIAVNSAIRLYIYRDPVTGLVRMSPEGATYSESEARYKVTKSTHHPKRV